jgi:hypothetical protein
LGVRAGRKGREAGADYQKPLGGRLERLLDVGNEQLSIYGTPNVSKISDTSAGMKTRRVCSASSAVVELSRSKSFILLQAERGAMAGKYNCASSILPYVLINFSIVQNYKKILK